LLYFESRITLNDSEIGGGKPASRRMGGNEADLIWIGSRLQLKLAAGTKRNFSRSTFGASLRGTPA
jgi:hypothetical protein